MKKSILPLLLVLLIGAVFSTACTGTAHAAPVDLPPVDLTTLKTGDPYGRSIEPLETLSWVEMDTTATQDTPQTIGTAHFWFRNGTPEMELSGVYFRIWKGSSEDLFNVTDGTYTTAYYNPAETTIVEQGIKLGDTFYFRLNAQTQKWEVAAGQ